MFPDFEADDVRVVQAHDGVVWKHVREALVTRRCPELLASQHTFLDPGHRLVHADEVDCPGGHHEGKLGAREVAPAMNGTTAAAARVDAHEPKAIISTTGSTHIPRILRVVLDPFIIAHASHATSLDKGLHGQRYIAELGPCLHHVAQIGSRGCS